jgi:hypothetical protein
MTDPTAAPKPEGIEELREMLERIVEIAEGRDQLDGFPRSTNERLRRLTACAEAARIALAALTVL